MAKKIRMTFKAEKNDGEYNLRDEVTLVDGFENYSSMCTAALYFAEHMEGFDGYTVEVFDDGEVK